MLKDITIGQYYPSGSCVHKLDPRIKIILTIVFIMGVFMVKTILGFCVLAVFTLILIKISKIPILFFLKGLKPLAIIMGFTAILNLFLTDGKIIFEWGILKITQEGIHLSIFMLLRIIFLVAGSSFMMYTTTPISLTSGLESLMTPLKKIGVPAHEISMMMSIALRFVPTLIEETDKIMSAQKARGANLDEGSIFKRAKALVPILIPLFISAFRRADDLAIAMESRCYNGSENRTKMKELKLRKKDIVAVLVFVFCLLCVIATNFIAT